ncbi:MAG: Fic family protein [Bacteroidales bacterium]|nr:Fic family protein [Bacteroidales bacterium]
MSNYEALYRQWQALQPVKEEYRQRLDRKFMLEFNFNSNHIEGNTLTYGQTELLLLFGKVAEAANMKDLEDMKASNVGLNMVKAQAVSQYPLTETFIRQLHRTILREDYTVYRNLPGGEHTSYVVHAGVYKTRPNSVITRTGERFDYASPEETPALMTDLVAWYREEEERGNLSLSELCALFHYRYIRIHPFEDGNGRIARLLVNYILCRHGYPMIVIKSSDKDAYLNALGCCDATVGTTPSVGAHAEAVQIKPFTQYVEACMERALSLCIKAAKGESIEEDDDFLKELKILEFQKKQDAAQNASGRNYSAEEVWNVLDFVYFPISEGFEKAIKAADSVFRFTHASWSSLLSKSNDKGDAVQITRTLRNAATPQVLDYADQAKSVWFECALLNPTHPKPVQLAIERQFYVTFYGDHYFVDGILNKNFPYGCFPSEQEKAEVVARFKGDLLEKLKKEL